MDVEDANSKFVTLFEKYLRNSSVWVKTHDLKVRYKGFLWDTFPIQQYLPATS